MKIYECITLMILLDILIFVEIVTTVRLLYEELFSAPFHRKARTEVWARRCLITGGVISVTIRVFSFIKRPDIDILPVTLIIIGITFLSIAGAGIIYFLGQLENRKKEDINDE